MDDFEIGMRVIRKRTDEAGFIRGVRKAKATMVEVRWETSGVSQWLPAEEVRVYDKSDPAPTPQRTGHGNTTPQYLVDLRKELRARRNTQYIADRRVEKLRAALVGLSDSRKNRTKMKASKLIQKFNDELTDAISSDERRENRRHRR